MAKLKFIPGSKKEIKTKIGSVLRYENAGQLPNSVAAAKELAFQTYYYFTLNAAIPQDSLRLQFVADFIKNVGGASVGALYPFEVPEITNGFPQWLDEIIRTLNPEYLGAAAETPRVTTGTQLTNPQYIAEWQRDAAHTPGKKWIIDAGLMYREDIAVQKARNEALAAVVKPGDQLRQYKQLSDLCAFGKDQAKNYDLIRGYYDLTFPFLQEAFQNRFPGCVEATMQYHEEDTGLGNLSDALSNYSKGEMVRSILSNTEHYSMLIWMAFNNLLTRDYKLEPSGIALKRLAPAFKFKYVMPLEVKIPGCRGVGLSDGVDSQGAVITNDSSIDQSVPVSEIKYFRKKVPAAFKRDSGFADSWTSPVSNEIVAETQILLRRHSTNFITFNTGGAVT